MTEEDGVTWLVRRAHLALKEDLPFSQKKEQHKIWLQSSTNQLP